MATILTINQLIPTSDDGVNIEGAFYPFANPGSWGLMQRAAFNRDRARVLEIEGATDPTAEDEAEYEALLRSLCERVVPGYDFGGIEDSDILGSVLAGFLLVEKQRRERLVTVRDEPSNGENSYLVSMPSGRKRTRRSG